MKSAWKTHGTIVHALFLAGIVLFTSLAGGCGTAGGDPGISYTGTTVVPAPPASIYPSPDELIATYFTAAQAEEMRRDAAPLLASYPGINVLSTSQYGRRFIVGTAHVRDIFDARVPQNYEMFKRYAWDNFGARLAYYERYAEAANKFIVDFDYDAVIFGPDELHPLFTNPATDTWMFLRDTPTVTYDFIYSSRVENREMLYQGGLKMRPIKQGEPLYSSRWMYYVPAEGTDYVAYGPYGDAVAADEQLRVTTGPSNYVPHDSTAETKQKRRDYGIVECPLSNRIIPVGGWKDEARADDNVKNGFSFKNNPVSNTWGGWGFYVLPLDQAFWTE